MPRFVNGKVFRFGLGLRPPTGYRFPMVRVQMAGPSGEFQPVIGKMDTGADLTILDESTARRLGIGKIDDKASRSGVAESATGGLINYHVHPVGVRLVDPTLELVLFAIEAGFSKDIRLNLFGKDWLDSICIALDSRLVFFLAD